MIAVHVVELGPDVGTLRVEVERRSYGEASARVTIQRPGEEPWTDWTERFRTVEAARAYAGVIVERTGKVAS